MTPAPVDRLLVLPLATGFGAGLLPRFPGTAGTAVGALAYWGLSALPAAAYAAACVAAAGFGVWLCGRAARALGEADPAAVVWDEIAGYWVAMSLAPRALGWALAGFVLFRFLDIVKPGPVGWVERRFSGGAGIMLDDLAAGVLTAAVLLAAEQLLAFAGAA